MKKKALIFGVTGQDGAFLAKFLLKKKYLVYGVKRKSSSLNTSRIDNIYQSPNNKKDFFLIYGDLTDSLSIVNIIFKVKPDEIYNLAAQSHVQVSFEIPEYTSNVNAIGSLRILEAIRFLKLEKKVKYYQAGTSEMFGSSPPPQNENTNFYPRSPYAVSKLFAHWICINYREAYKMFIVSGICFNHESPLRGEEFVTRKITKKVAQIFNAIKSGQSFTPLELGNIDAKRDWSDAEDFIDGIWRMLNQDKYDPNYNGIPKEYVFSSNKTHTIREFVELAFSFCYMVGSWKNGTGKPEDEKYYVHLNNKPVLVVQINPKFYRPAEVELLLGDSTKARQELGWKPYSSFGALVEKMIRNDLEAYEV